MSFKYNFTKRKFQLLFPDRGTAITYTVLIGRWRASCADVWTAGVVFHVEFFDRRTEAIAAWFNEYDVKSTLNLQREWGSMCFFFAFCYLWTITPKIERLLLVFNPFSFENFLWKTKKSRHETLSRRHFTAFEKCKNLSLLPDDGQECEGEKRLDRIFWLTGRA